MQIDLSSTEQNSSRSGVRCPFGQGFKLQAVNLAAFKISYFLTENVRQYLTVNL